MKMNVAHMTLDFGAGDERYAEYRSNHSTYREGDPPIAPMNPQLMIDVRDFEEAQELIATLERSRKRKDGKKEPAATAVPPAATPAAGPPVPPPLSGTLTSAPPVVEVPVPEAKAEPPAAASAAPPAKVEKVPEEKTEAQRLAEEPGAGDLPNGAAMIANLTIDADKLKDAQIKEVIVALQDQGIAGEENLTAACVALAATGGAPKLARIANMRERVHRTLEILGNAA